MIISFLTLVYAQVLSTEPSTIHQNGNTVLFHSRVSKAVEFYRVDNLPTFPHRVSKNMLPAEAVATSLDERGNVLAVLKTSPMTVVSLSSDSKLLHTWAVPSDKADIIKKLGIEHLLPDANGRCLILLGAQKVADGEAIYQSYLVKNGVWLETSRLTYELHNNSKLIGSHVYWQDDSGDSILKIAKLSAMMDAFESNAILPADERAFTLPDEKQSIIVSSSAGTPIVFGNWTDLDYNKKKYDFYYFDPPESKILHHYKSEVTLTGDNYPPYVHSFASIRPGKLIYMTMDGTVRVAKSNRVDP